ncbi:histidine-rich glycoprotein-like [Myzus persicae]|uniref:histidine-rich glycoprotein-like n=1 Tax=Myzus persicae TaxID=13164 RepID=UPI000B9373B7|nr:histidine-rich glycoprotein-like [Myzus persicae]
MKTSVAILFTILSVAAASPLFFGSKDEHHVIHVPYHVHKVPVYIKEPVYIEKPVYIYKTVDHHHEHHYHQEDQHDDHYSHDDHYDSHY